MVVYLPQGAAAQGSGVSASMVVKTVALAQPSAAQAFRLLESFETLWRTSHHLHAHAPTERFLACTMPAILLGQYLLVLEQGSQQALGLCTWAKMDKASEYRYLLDPTGMGKEDWCSGDRLWLIDWIGQASVNRLMAQLLKSRMLPDQVLRTLRVRPNSNRGQILSFCGAGIDRSAARGLLQGYHAEYLRMHRPA